MGLEKGAVAVAADFAAARLELGELAAFAVAHAETVVHRHPRSWTNSSGQKSWDADAAGDLSVALPVGVFSRDPGVVLRGLNVTVGIDRS